MYWNTYFQILSRVLAFKKNKSCNISIFGWYPSILHCIRLGLWSWGHLQLQLPCVSTLNTLPGQYRIWMVWYCNGYLLPSAKSPWIDIDHYFQASQFLVTGILNYYSCLEHEALDSKLKSQLEVNWFQTLRSLLTHTLKSSRLTI